MDSYKAVIPSKISIVGCAVKETMEYLQKACCDLDESTLFELRVILNELIINAIKHGNLYDPSKFVKIYAEVSPKGYIMITIEDEGEGYDYNCLLSETRGAYAKDELCNLAEGGRGILIAKNLCSSLNYNNKGNVVFITKKISRDTQGDFV